MVSHMQDECPEILPFADLAQPDLPRKSIGMASLINREGVRPLMSELLSKNTQKLDLSSSGTTRH